MKYALDYVRRHGLADLIRACCREEVLEIQ